MIAPKQHISDLVHHCESYGMRHIVISPGSRNAPLTRAFAASKITCHSVVDERSAAFVALGMAHQLGAPVAVLCTSGSAPLNYGPAISEAYYLRVPLVVLTADRPARLVDHQDSQTIRQNNVFTNIVKGSFSLPEEPNDLESLVKSRDIVAKAFRMALYPDHGPVHINIPLEDPLYVNVLADKPMVPSVDIHPTVQSEQIPQASIDRFCRGAKKMIVCGQGLWSKRLEDLLQKVSEDPSIVVVAENTSNLQGDNFIHYPDFQVLSQKGDVSSLAPDTVISFGGHLVSKHLKILLRNNPAHYHLRLDPEMRGIDTYETLSEEVAIEPELFFEDFVQHYEGGQDGTFAQNWHATPQKPVDEEYQVLESLISGLAPGSIVHLGNSMAVRHAGKIPTRKDLSYHSNRGVAGIDGCLSTAVGVAKSTDKMVLCCLGDLSFVYDSNGLWNNRLPANLRVVVLNNCGGDIFRRLQGPSDSPGYEELFIAHHPVDMQKLVEAYGVSYLKTTASHIESVQQEFYTGSTALVLEVIIEREKC